MSRREPLLLLEDIIESIQKIKKYTAGFSKDAFLIDDKTVDAVIRNFEIIEKLQIEFQMKSKINFN